MNRDILFRGKRIDNSEWVYGSLVYVNQNSLFIFDASQWETESLKDLFADVGKIEWRHTMSCEEPRHSQPKQSFFYQVDPKTVGQFTGLCDKNGVKIFYDLDLGYVGESLGGSTIEQRDLYLCEVVINGSENSKLLKGDL